jgi:hypothetical protein
MHRIVKVCATVFLLLTVACAQVVTHDPVPVENLTNRPAFLSDKQYAVVVAAWHAAPATERRQMMVTVFKGVLILYRGDPEAPLGLVKPGTGDCGRYNTTQCRHCYGIIGSGNQSYCPEPARLLPTGSRVINTFGVYWTRLDKIVHDAYGTQGIDASWNPKPPHFFDD